MTMTTKDDQGAAVTETRGPQAELIEAVLQRQAEIVGAMHAGATSWLEIDLTMAQLKTLVVLADEGPSAIGAVGEVLGVGLPTASHLVERLVRAGLARRVEDPQDRRRTLASVTPEGEELLRGLREGGRERFRLYLRRLAPEDLQALLRGMTALARAVEGVAQPDGDLVTAARDESDSD